MLRRVARAVAGLGAICAGLVVPPATPALADSCAWATPATAVLHGTSFSLSLFPGCVTPTRLLINGVAVSFAHPDPADPSSFLVNTTVLDSGSYVFSAESGSAQLTSGTFEVNNAPPSVSISDPVIPVDGQPVKVHGVVAMTVDPETAHVNDASIASVQALDPSTGEPTSTTTSEQAAAAGKWVVSFDTTGWTNGPADFTLLVNQNDGNRGYLTVTLDVENQASTLSESITPSTVAYGKPVTITGQLLIRLGQPMPLAGRTVSLNVIRIATTTPALVTTLVTDGSGNVKYVFTPKAGAHYFLAFNGEKASPSSADGYATSTSPLRPLTLTSTIALRLSSTHQVHGHAFVGFIATTPGDRGVPFQIQFLSGNAWKTVAAPKTAGAKTNISITFAARGTYQVRVVLAPSAATTATSNYARLFVS